MKLEGLTWPLLLSALVHVTLICLPWVNPRATPQALQSPALEVILLNARKPSSPALAPDRTQALAQDRKSTRLNSSHIPLSRMPSSA